VHPVGYAPSAAIVPNKMVARIISLHTQPEHVAEILNAAKPKMAVLSNIVVFGPKGPDLSAEGEEKMMGVIRQHYSGPLTLGQDLMAFEVGDQVVQLH